MIYSMITGDMFTFGIIYLIVLFGFSQAFYFLYKGHPQVESSLFATYPSTWMALFQTTLGDYNVISASICSLLHININSFSPESVFRFEQYDVPEFGENRVCHFHDIRADFAAQHVDRYDGKHIRARHWAIGEGVDEAMGQNCCDSGTCRFADGCAEVLGSVFDSLGPIRRFWVWDAWGDGHQKQKQNAS